ncbi:2-hydroxymuconate tautomerase [Sinisalibacter aestuarii]|uniref:Tautomerase n=1 Tax=Sinisalibacter aestuarii TaxID=2949426 RepID=A0ABQ5LYR4_9RHOB|nr:2-hydroxymuconate tautomerase [Sinisalibacter aestuarii]GKY90095.1 hypothetical protein STA1M1_39640 [Sinisalibacter aestuarii]
MPLVEITIVEGRSLEQKRMLMAGVADAVERALAAPREAIRIAIREIPVEHWAIGGVSLPELQAAEAARKAADET